MEGKDERKKQERQSMQRMLVVLGVIAGCLVCSIAVTAVVVRINRAENGIYLLPFILSVGIFIFSTLGFFLTEGKRESIYGLCSIAGAACAIVQLALIF